MDNLPLSSFKPQTLSKNSGCEVEIYVITIDIDDVIFDTNRPLFRRAYEICGKPFVATTDYAMSNIPDDVRNEFFKLIYSDAIYQGRLCDDRIPYWLNLLMRNPWYKVIFVSARPASQTRGTFAQIRNNGIKLTDTKKLFCVGARQDFSGADIMKRSKRDVILEMGSDLHIDDGPHNIAECIDAGIHAVLISNRKTTWNHSYAEQMHGKIGIAPGLIAALHAERVIDLSPDGTFPFTDALLEIQARRVRRELSNVSPQLNSKNFRTIARLNALSMRFNGKETPAFHRLKDTKEKLLAEIREYRMLQNAQRWNQVRY